MSTRAQIITTLRDYLIQRHLGALGIDDIDEHQPLVTSSVLTSVAVVECVAFIEETFHVEVAPHEMEGAAIDTLSDMADLICAKLQK